MTIGMGNLVAGLVLVGISAFAWCRWRNVGGKTWAFRIVPLGLLLLAQVCDSGRGALCGALGILAVYAFAAYRGGWRLDWPQNRGLNGVWWCVHVVVYFVMALIVCLPLAGIVRTVVRFSPLATEGDWPWAEGRISAELPFAVDYKRAKTFTAEYDKRIRFKSGKTIGIWPDTGGGGPFAVYALPSGEYYLVDGLDFEFIRSEYRVNCRNETVERKGKHVWIRIPDGALSITSASDRDVTVETEKGKVRSSKTAPIGDSLKGRKFIGRIHTNGRFVAGSDDPLQYVRDEKGEAKWNRVAWSNDLPFALERKCPKRGLPNELRVVFKSGKSLGLGRWLRGPIAVGELSKDVYCLQSTQTDERFKKAVRVDVRRELLDLQYFNAWIRVPDGTLEITGCGKGVVRNGEPETYSITVQTEKGEVKSTNFELVGHSLDDVKTIGVVEASVTKE